MKLNHKAKDREHHEVAAVAALLRIEFRGVPEQCNQDDRQAGIEHSERPAEIAGRVRHQVVRNHGQSRNCDSSARRQTTDRAGEAVSREPQREQRKEQDDFSRNDGSRPGHGLHLKGESWREGSLLKRYCPSCNKAARKGATETRINPLYGWYISRIRKIAALTASAEMKRLATTVALGGANSPKLMKRMVSQKTMISSNGIGTEMFFCANINQRVWAV